MGYMDIVNDPGSTTKIFNNLTSNYKIDVLFSDEDGLLFKRIVLIKLDNIPVMVAVSNANMKGSPLFFDILKNSKTNPIGVRLFAPQSHILRSKMIVTKITIVNINDIMIREIVDKFILGNSDIYRRYSTFSYENQRMELTEYVLPGLKQVFDKYIQPRKRS